MNNLILAFQIEKAKQAVKSGKDVLYWDTEYTKSRQPSINKIMNKNKLALSIDEMEKQLDKVF